MKAIRFYALFIIFLSIAGLIFGLVGPYLISSHDSIEVLQGYLVVVVVIPILGYLMREIVTDPIVKGFSRKMRRYL